MVTSTKAGVEAAPRLFALLSETSRIRPDVLARCPSGYAYTIHIDTIDEFISVMTIIGDKSIRTSKLVPNHSSTHFAI